MKKTVIIIAAILALGWYGDYYCRQNGLPLKEGIPHMFQSVKDSLFSRQNGQSLTDGISHMFHSVKDSLFSKKNKPQTLTEPVPYADVSKPERSSNSTRFKCDGRTRCSQMTSCEEAMFFIKNCPDTKMDGDNDGIPCESQWCN